MLEIENKIRGYVSGMEPSLGGGEQNKVTSRFGACLGGGEKAGNPAGLKRVPGGVVVIDYVKLATYLLGAWCCAW